MDVDWPNSSGLALLLCGLCAVWSSARSAEPDSSSKQMEEVLALGQPLDVASEPTPITEKLVKVPGNFGDPLRALAALPGVLQPSESNGEPAVRGSSPDDNSYLIDGLPAGYVFHDFGNSIFNEDVIRDFGFHPAGFGARYGEASGALLDISLRAPRNEPRATTIDVSMLRAGVLLEGRITDKQAFYVSFRESLVHLLLASAYDEEERLEDDIAIDRYPRARDLQAKYSWQPNTRHDFSLVAIGSQDDAALTLGARSDTALVDPASRGAAATSTAFSSLGASWVYRQGEVAVTTRIGRLSRSDNQSLGGGNESLDLSLDQWTAKSQVELSIRRGHQLAVGVERREQAYDYAVRLRYRSCTAFSTGCDTTLADLTESDREQGISLTDVFLEDRWTPTSNLDLTAGVRYSHDDYLQRSFLEPRFAGSWRYRPRWALSASWGRYHQLPPIQQIVPVFGNPSLRPLEAEHFVLGVEHEISNDWSLKAEFYYKKLSQLVVEIQTAENYINDASGEAHGLELMLMRQNQSRWHGWATLSFARTFRRNGLNGQESRFDTDTPIIANLVLSYELTPTWTLGARWHYRSGMPYTPITGNEENPDFPGYYRPTYGGLNTERAAAYHRLDLRLERPIRFARAEGFFYIDIINAYGRQNTGAASYEPIPDSAEYRVVDDGGLPLLPSVGIKLRI